MFLVVNVHCGVSSTLTPHESINFCILVHKRLRIYWLSLFCWYIYVYLINSYEWKYSDLFVSFSMLLQAYSILKDIYFSIHIIFDYVCILHLIIELCLIIILHIHWWKNILFIQSKQFYKSIIKSCLTYTFLRRLLYIFTFVLLLGN